MKRFTSKFGIIGLFLIIIGLLFIVFNIPIYLWLILFGAFLVTVGINLLR